jgi:hypothetical protein
MILFGYPVLGGLDVLIFEGLDISIDILVGWKVLGIACLMA